MKSAPTISHSEKDQLKGLCGYYSANGEAQAEKLGVKIADSLILDSAIKNANDETFLAPGLDMWTMRRQQRELSKLALELCDGCPAINACPGARTLENIYSGDSSPYEKERLNVLKQIAEQLTKVPGTVLKGGLALRLYGLPRDTNDADFDIYTRGTSLPLGDSKVVRNLIKEFGGSGIPKKNTPTTLRYIATYQKPGSAEYYPIKVEYRLINSESPEARDTPRLNSIDGVTVYSIGEILSQKFAAATTRSKSRDLFDISWILSQYPTALEDVDTSSLSSLLTLLKPTLGGEVSKVVPAELIDRFAADPNIPHWVSLEASNTALNQLADTVSQEIHRRDEARQPSSIHKTA